MFPKDKHRPHSDPKWSRPHSDQMNVERLIQTKLSTRKIKIMDTTISCVTDLSVSHFNETVS